MPKYNQFKYGQGKYGRYDIEIQDGTVDLSQLKKYRLKTINSKKRESRPITNQSVKIKDTSGPVKVRIKTDNGNWVYLQSMDLKGNPIKIRIKSIGHNSESPWVESVIGTLRKRG